MRHDVRDASLKLTYGEAEFFHCCAKVSSDTSDKQQPLCHFRVCVPVDDFLQKKTAMRGDIAVLSCGGW
jgi:hypothetical protein